MATTISIPKGAVRIGVFCARPVRLVRSTKPVAGGGFHCTGCGKTWRFQQWCPTCDRRSKQRMDDLEADKSYAPLRHGGFMKYRFSTGGCY